MGSGASWSTDHEATEPSLLVAQASSEHVEVRPAAVAALPPHGTADSQPGLAGRAEILEGGSSSGEEEVFLPALTSSTVRREDLVQLRHTFGIPPDFQLEVPLETDRVCNPPPGRVSMYLPFFVAGLRLPLFPFFY